MSLKTCSQLQSAIHDFISDLKENIFNQNSLEQGDFTVLEFFFSNMHPERVMFHCEDKFYPHRKKIMNQDESFFIENSKNLFEGLPSDRIQYYEHLITKTDRIADEDRELFWAHLQVILSIIEKYRKEKKNK